MSIDHTLAMRLRRAYMAMHRAAQKHFSSYGVTADQYVVLCLLAEQEGIRQQELAERAFSDPNTITAMLTLLEQKKLLRRKPDKNDGRARLVSLTPQGRRLQQRLVESIGPFHAAMQQAIGSRQEVFMQCLQEIEAVAKGQKEEPIAG